MKFLFSMRHSTPYLTKLFVFTLALGCCLVGIRFSVQAQDQGSGNDPVAVSVQEEQVVYYNGSCDLAESTAQAMSCVNRERERAQNRLQAVFETLAQSQTAEMQAALAQAQKSWLTYRDSACQWQAGWAEADSLKRVYELACIAALTSSRAADLEAWANREVKRETPREFGSIPRWINVLSKDYPDIFWQTGHRLRADLNCDDFPEEIIAGLKILKPDALVESTGAAVEGAPILPEPESYKLSSVIAVADNPVTGRPQISLVALPLNGVQNPAGEAAVNGKRLCSPSIMLAPMSLPLVKPALSQKTANDATEANDVGIPEGAAGQEGEQSCRTSLKVSDMMCRTYRIENIEGVYKVSPL